MKNTATVFYISPDEARMNRIEKRTSSPTRGGWYLSYNGCWSYAGSSRRKAQEKCDYINL